MDFIFVQHPDDMESVEPCHHCGDQIMALNIEIDEIYDQLTILVAKRDTTQSDLWLENQISELCAYLRVRQRQEADLIRAMVLSPPIGAIAIGLDILAHIDELRAKYGNITTQAQQSS